MKAKATRLTHVSPATSRPMPAAGVALTRKQRRRLEKQRVATETAQVRLQVETGTSGGVRPAKEPAAPCRDLRPKSGYTTKGQRSGPLTKK